MNQRKLIPANGISTVAAAMPPCPLLNQSIELSVPSAMLVRGPRRCGFTRDVESRRSFRGPPAGPGEQTGLHAGTARVVAEDRRCARGIGRSSPDPPGWADPEANRAGRSGSTTRARPSGAGSVRPPGPRTCGPEHPERTGPAPPGTAGPAGPASVGSGRWPPFVTSRAEGVQLAAGPGRRRRPTGSPPGCRSARSPARRRS